MYNGPGLSQHDTNKNKLALGHPGPAYGPFSAAAELCSEKKNTANEVLEGTKYSVVLHYGNYIEDRPSQLSEYVHTNKRQPGTAATRKAPISFGTRAARHTRHTVALLRYPRPAQDTSTKERVNIVSVVCTLFRAHKIR